MGEVDHQLALNDLEWTARGGPLGSTIEVEVDMLLDLLDQLDSRPPEGEILDREGNAWHEGYEAACDDIGTGDGPDLGLVTSEQADKVIELLERAKATLRAEAGRIRKRERPVETVDTKGRT